MPPLLSSFRAKSSGQAMIKTGLSRSACATASVKNTRRKGRKQPLRRVLYSFAKLSITPKPFFDPLFIGIHRFVGALKHQINGSVVRRQFRHANRGGILFPQRCLVVLQTVFIALFQRFNNEPFIKRVTEEGLHVIGMLKDNRQKYRYNGKSLGLKDLSKYIHFDGFSGVFGSVLVKTEKQRIPVKLVFVRNRNKRNEYIVILSTDTDLSDAEIVRLYGNRWSIECCFKVCKSLLKLGKEFHGVSYDLTVSSTALVFTRYILLEWIRRQENDGRTLGELVYCVFDEVRDMELADSLRMLFDILLTGIRQGAVRIDEAVRVQLLNWFCSQPRFIQTLFLPLFGSLDSANCVPA